MSATTDLGVLARASETAARTSATAGLASRYLRWRRARQQMRILRALDPHMAMDIGAAASSDGRPEGFAVDPRPLWGIGLMPEPVPDPLPHGRDGAAPRSAASRPVGYHHSDQGAGRERRSSLLCWTLAAVALLTLGHLALHPPATSIVSLPDTAVHRAPHR